MQRLRARLHLHSCRSGVLPGTRLFDPEALQELPSGKEARSGGLRLPFGSGTGNTCDLFGLRPAYNSAFRTAWRSSGVLPGLLPGSKRQRWRWRRKRARPRSLIGFIEPDARVQLRIRARQTMFRQSTRAKDCVLCAGSLFAASLRCLSSARRFCVLEASKGQPTSKRLPFILCWLRPLRGLQMLAIHPDFQMFLGHPPPSPINWR